MKKLMIILTTLLFVTSCVKKEEQENYGQNSFHQTVEELGAAGLVQAGVFGKIRDYSKLENDFNNSLNVLSLPPVFTKPIQIAAGGSNTCAIYNEGVNCWGERVNNKKFKKFLQELKNPKQIAVGADQVCVLDAEGVKCSRIEYGDVYFPSNLKDPKQIVTGDFSNKACALDEESVKCWYRFGKTQALPDIKKPKQIAIGSLHTCVIDEEGVKCWRFDGEVQTDVPLNLKNPRQIAVGKTHKCVIDEEGVKCWGDNSQGQTDVPLNLKNPQQIVVGSAHTCVLDEDGVKCWGEANSWWQIWRATFVPSNIMNPRQIVAGEGHNCVIDDKGIVCWGANESGQVIPPPNLKQPRQTEHFDNRTCALDEESVKCWGGFPYGLVAVPTNLKNPRQIAMSKYDICVLDDKGINCSRYYGSGYVVVPTNLKSPRQIAVNENAFCVLDDEGVKCSPISNSGQNDKSIIPANLKNPRHILLTNYFVCVQDDEGLKCKSHIDNRTFSEKVYSIRNLNGYDLEIGTKDGYISYDLSRNEANKEENKPIDLKLLFNIGAMNSNLVRAPITFDVLSSLLQKLPIDTKLELFSAMLLAPVIESMDSAFAETTIKPAFKDIITEQKEELKIKDLNQFEWNEQNKKMALTVLSASIESSFGFFSIEEKTKLNNLVGLLGKTTADSSKENISNLITEIRKNKDVFSKLSNSPKSKFLVDTMELVITWIEGKI